MRPPWDESTWQQLDRSMANADWYEIARQARHVLKTYSTSFFLVTRFLPPEKRSEVEIIYAAVRYPDEIVDTFPLSSCGKLALLQEWENNYELGLNDSAPLVAHAPRRAASPLMATPGIPPFLAAFTEVVNRRGIPPEHYTSFLDAMRQDVVPRRYATLNDLIDNYIYGSAIVVGYFLAYVYGASDFPRALESSRNLGIALQLTNFLRDVGEDQRRGRVYLPQDMLQAEGITKLNIDDSGQLEALKRVLRQVSALAEDYYAKSERDLDAFSPDCVTAIRACIDVYRQLNLRIGRSAEGVRHRESVPMATKFNVLPPSKYWRLPLAWLGAI